MNVDMGLEVGLKQYLNQQVKSVEDGPLVNFIQPTSIGGGRKWKRKIPSS